MPERQPGLGVGVAIIHCGKVLLGKRAIKEKAKHLYGAGQWTFPGGKCIFGQSIQENAAREVLEETGLEIPIHRLELVSVSDEIDLVRDVHYVTVGLVYNLYGGNVEARNMEPDEITEWVWFSIEDELPKLSRSQVFLPTANMIAAMGWRLKNGDFVPRANLR